MLYFRPANNRGHTKIEWLDSKHTFSFGGYYDPNHMGFSVLRVINDDTVLPGAGFDTHGHKDMEIISYILQGAIEHRDSMGNHFILPVGEIQRMTAGSGITHSEFNHSDTETLKFLQIWILPNQADIEPSYDQKSVEQTGQITPLVTPDGKDGSLTIHQDVSIYRLQLNEGESISFETPERAGYLHIIEGQATTNHDYLLKAGDGLGVQSEKLVLEPEDQGVTALWFDLPT